jgi:hypothetical protein
VIVHDESRLSNFLRQLRADWHFATSKRWLFTRQFGLRGLIGPFLHLRWSGRLCWTSDEIAAIYHSIADETRQRMIKRMANACVPDGADAMLVNEIFDRISQDRCGMFYRDLLKFLEEKMMPIADYEIPWLMRGLILHDLNADEARDLGEKVRYHKWEAIPENYFDLLLTARWEHDRVHRHRPNYTPNDEIDRWRTAVALSCAQLFVTDKYMAGLCQRAGVLDVANLLVLSVSQTDQFRNFLINSATAVET